MALDERKRREMAIGLEQGLGPRTAELVMEYFVALGDLPAKVDGLGRKADVLTQRVDGLDKKVDVLTQRVDGLDKKVDVLTQRVDGLDQKVDHLDHKVELLRHELTAEIHRTGRNQTLGIASIMAVFNASLFAVAAWIRF